MNARRTLLGTVSVAVLAAAAGCGGSAVRSGAAAPGLSEAAPAAMAPPTSGSHSSGSGSTSSSAGLVAGDSSSGGDIVVGSPGADVARSVTAAYTVPAGSFLASFDTVIAAAVALQGYVVSSETSPDAAGRIVSGQVTLAIPTASMASLLNALPSDFTASSIDFASVDDTSGIVDVNARLASAHAHLTALQALLAKATSLADITTLEQQIEDVETSIDTDQGRLTTLTQAVTYATAVIKLKERGAVAVARASGPSVPGGISTGWSNAVAVIAVALEVLVTAIPAAVLVLIGWLVWRRRRRVAAA